MKVWDGDSCKMKSKKINDLNIVFSGYQTLAHIIDITFKDITMTVCEMIGSKGKHMCVLPTISYITLVKEDDSTI